MNINENTVICEQCGAVMRPIDPDKPLGMVCPECGWGWATTYTDPILDDETEYVLYLDRGNSIGKSELKTISEITGCNYIQAKSIIISPAAPIYTGKARDVQKQLKYLIQTGMKYHTEPEWPYSI